MSYLYLVGTIFFESIGVALLNKSDGFNNWKYLLAGLVFFNTGMISFAMALKDIDMTIANTTWAGTSILVVAILGYIIFDEHSLKIVETERQWSEDF
jgi:multidrug transporter EmrE-like cation transporter